MHSLNEFTLLMYIVGIQFVGKLHPDSIFHYFSSILTSWKKITPQTSVVADNLRIRQRKVVRAKPFGNSKLLGQV